MLNAAIHTLDVGQLLKWYSRAQIDYAQLYMSIYAAFNAWYRATTNTVNDRQAINILRSGVGMWNDYCQGDGMQELQYPMALLVELTQREPLSHATPHWKGEVAGTKDWASLLEYWYRVRCLVMHGAEINPHYVHLAYETLNIFMGEVIQRSGINTVYNTYKKGYN